MVRIILITTFTTCLMCFCSCEKTTSNEPTYNPIVGKWECTARSFDIACQEYTLDTNYFIFTEDKKFTLIIIGITENTKQIAFTANAFGTFEIINENFKNLISRKNLT